jgi:hypothetical protein
VHPTGIQERNLFVLLDFAPTSNPTHPTYATLIGAIIQADGRCLISERMDVTRMVEEEQHLDDWIPSTETDRKAVYDQLDRLLESPLFRNSKRYPNLLRYVVEQALEGNEALLKERLLGMTVFHRPPDYDTNQDTVVRLTAGEVRKRIAQYYHQPNHAGELQIDLRPGSYVPVFRRPSESRGVGEEQLRNGQAPGINDALETSATKPHRSPEDAKALVGTSVRTPEEMPREIATRRRPSSIRLFLGAVIFLALVGGTLFWRASSANAHAADRQLWAPILQEPGQVQLVVADLSATLNTSQAQQRMQAGGLFDLLRMGEIVNYRDILAETDLVSFLSRHNKPYKLALSSQASYPDLQRSASVLVGGLDNVWTMRVTEPLRYHFIRRGMTFTYAIEDREHPEKGGWNVDLAQPSERATEDYAIVARIFDVTTGRPVLVAAGIGANGTAAASQFLLDPDRVAELAPHAPRDWQRLNMEAVIRTRIFDNHAGPPYLVACYFW